MKRKTVGIKETGTTFTTGEVFTPKFRDVQAVFGKIHEMGLESDVMPHGTTIENCIRHRSTASAVVPDLLARVEFRKNQGLLPDIFALDACLWVLACWAYKWNRGPYPGTLDSRPKPKKRAPVEKFKCPYCGNVWKPPRNYKNRKPILRSFGRWISEHDQCHNDYIELAPEVT